MTDTDHGRDTSVELDTLLPNDGHGSERVVADQAKHAASLDAAHASLPSSARSSFSLDFESPYRIQLEPTSFRPKALTKFPVTLNLFHGLGLVVGVIIGSGIFAAPGLILQRAGSVAGAAIVWVLCGLVAALGAACYAELGCALPTSGGEAIYLERAFGELFGFLYEWTALLVMKPAGNAIPLVVFADYFCRAILGHTPADWVEKLVSVVVLLLVTAVHCWSTKVGASAQSFLMVLKLLVVAGIGVTGVCALIFQDEVVHRSGNFQDVWSGTSADPADWAIAFYTGLFAYDGWNNLNYVVGELRNPARDLPLSIGLGLPLVVVCYLLANLAYCVALPKHIIVSTDTVAMDFAAVLFGPIGGFVLAACVAMSTLGAVNGSLFTNARIVHRAATRQHLPAIFSHLHPRRKTPVATLLLQAAITLICVALGSFEWLVRICGVIAFFFYGACAAAVLVLRRKEPELERPLRAPLLAVWVFLASCVALIIITIWRQPVEAAIGFGTLLSGVCVWALVLHRHACVEVLQHVWHRIGASDLSCIRRPATAGYARQSNDGL
ncbi:amino acid permease-domain-containing protein [Thamnocephalis sphaerospora]|uniref:Amino acid permease-domain-containing protein n=1 Tax=Thamnocephalis sphaerospora TaxID=78915 RepID=A0A4P9XXG3_9FUNG|nr:amino acid permease-domain-containing protein [Thamnocephalis sphaerospora]|eukprot:RKP11068.1 amino acid permease-domain-containing protein [Thamnocephalis sphaerospora]